MGGAQPQAGRDRTKAVVFKPRQERTLTNEIIIMKKILILLSLAAMVSCADFLSSGEKGLGELDWRFSGEDYILTRTNGEVLDTNDFILKVSNSSGKVIYDGKYGDSPDRLVLAKGSYSVSVRSIAFREPAFSSPLYGDDQVAVVEGGGKCTVKLVCTMLNSGVRLKVGEEFAAANPGGGISVRSQDGSLQYGFNERRTGYFMPGKVIVTLVSGGADKALVTRELSAREVLDLKLESVGNSGGGMSVVVDTSKTWLTDDYSGDDGPAPGSDRDHALSVVQASASAGLTGVWVKGYIVGGDLTSAGSSMNTGPVFTKDTHIAIGARSSVLEKSSCISVELKKGPIREALNLVDNPDLLGRNVFLKGDVVEAYYGIPGLKNVTEYAF